MNRIREIRERLGLSQMRLSIKSGVNQSEISRIERSGITPRDDEKRWKLAKVLGVPSAELFPDPMGAPRGNPLAPKKADLFKSSAYEDYKPAPMPPAIAPPAPPLRHSTCKWCGIKYNVEHEVKIMVGDKAIKIYGHLSCLEQDVRSDGLDLKKRGSPR
jgi:transcriptional regulator with XRE-family HTH domain